MLRPVRIAAWLFLLALSPLASRAGAPPGSAVATPEAAKAGAADSDPIRARAEARTDALVAEQFNLTRGRSFAARAAPFQDELLLPPDGGERDVRVWAEASQGVIALRLFDPQGALLASSSGRVAELRAQRAFPAGSYRVELDPSRAEAGQAVIAVKGHAMGSCALDPATLERPAEPARGFWSPYLLYAPPGATRLLIAPNNTGFPTEAPVFLRASASCQLEHEAAALRALDVAILVPLFPRPATADEAEDLDLHGLTRAALEVKEPRLARVDRQLVAMIDDAREQLAKRAGPLQTESRPIPPRVLLSGFSASGSFAQRFALLHPERVLAVASGSPGGWPTVPLAALEGTPLPWPIGVGDLDALAGAPLDRRALARVRFFFYLGDRDENDAVPHRDNYSAKDQALVDARFGKTPLARWPRAERLYRQAGLQPIFKLYPGVAHATTAESERDVLAFFRDALAGDAAR